MSLIECAGLTKSYGGPRGRGLDVLSNLPFAIEAGEIISIIGPSGCGKSPLLKIIAGLIPETAGTIRISGRTPEEARRARQFGFVFQEPVLLPWRDAGANARLP